MSRPSPSGRSAVWRRAAWPCTLGRPGVQVAKGSSDLISSFLTGGRGGSRTFESVSVGGRLPGRLALTSPAPLVEARDRLDSSLFFFSFFFLTAPLERGISRGFPPLTRARDKLKRKKQLQTVDRSAPASMKNAANCVNQCELQDTLIIDVSNAHGGLGSLPGPRPVEGRLLPLRDFAVSSSLVMGPRLGRFLVACSRGRLGFRIDPVRDAV